jgi:hypothetical protein
MSKVISLAKLTRELRLTSYPSRFLNIINAPNMNNSGWFLVLNMTCRLLKTLNMTPRLVVEFQYDCRD